jgi:hypothetical protein
MTEKTNPEKFYPDECEVAMNASRDEVGVSFMRDDGSHIEIFFRRHELPYFVGMLQKKIEPGSVTPIRPHNLQMGMAFRPAGYSVNPHPSGDVVLTCMFSITENGRERGVSLPLRFDRSSATAILKEFSEVLSSPSS